MNIIVQILAAAVGTIAFGAIFSVPKQYYPYCGLIGGAGWAVYVILWENMQLFTEPTVVFLATVLAILLSRFFAVKER